MAKANDHMGPRVLSDAELDLVAGGDPGNGNGAQVTRSTITGTSFTQTEQNVVTPSGNFIEQLTQTIDLGTTTQTLHAVILVK